MNWDDYFFGICDRVKDKSKDPSTKVGVVFVGKDREILMTGFNGLPRNVKDDPNDYPERYSRPDKYLWTSHAEVNAIAFAAKNGVSLRGSTVYTLFFPCSICTGLMIQCGVETIVVKNGYSKEASKSSDKKRDDMWQKSFEIAHMMMMEAGINFREVE